MKKREGAAVRRERRRTEVWRRRRGRGDEVLTVIVVVVLVVADADSDAPLHRKRSAAPCQDLPALVDASTASEAASSAAAASTDPRNFRCPSANGPLPRPRTRALSPESNGCRKPRGFGPRHVGCLPRPGRGTSNRRRLGTDCWSSWSASPSASRKPVVDPDVQFAALHNHTLLLHTQ
jgi:hypothetical protein